MPYAGATRPKATAPVLVPYAGLSVRAHDTPENTPYSEDTPSSYSRQTMDLTTT